MPLRITPHRQLVLGQSYTQQHFAKSNVLQNQISSGERIHRPSEDPEGQRLILEQQQTIARLENEVTSISFARVYLNQSNVELLYANQLLVQAKSLAIQARQATDQAELDVIANELDGYLHTLDRIANASLNGRFLFAGAKNDQAPFTGIVDGVTEYHGSQRQGDVVLPTEDDITAFLSGEETFSFINSAGDERVNIFETVRALRDEFRDRPNQTADQWGARIDKLVSDLDESSDHILTVVGRQSVSLQQLDRLETRAEDLILEAKSLLTETQSPDFASAIIELQEEQNLLQYSLATITRIFDLSILNFLS